MLKYYCFLPQPTGYVEDASKFEQHALELLLNRLSTTFHTNHFLMLDLKQRLLSIYRDMILLGNNMSNRLLQRDIELCNELLPVIETVEPGISRLRGEYFNGHLVLSQYG